MHTRHKNKETNPQTHILNWSKKKRKRKKNLHVCDKEIAPLTYDKLPNLWHKRGTRLACGQRFHYYYYFHSLQFFFFFAQRMQREIAFRARGAVFSCAWLGGRAWDLQLKERRTYTHVDFFFGGEEALGRIVRGPTGRSVSLIFSNVARLRRDMLGESFSSTHLWKSSVRLFFSL